ncbi:hypothetical protein VNI00_013666 [Paramarasmius palmivorus]|uniref:DUF6593 domain-containing protein n=1 Tax=Paramarasmius palmivorus TaxID=297713 RepID=A0AAW0BVI0_9AGAR
MNSTPLPYIFEDRTGQLTGSDFDDMYDRLFFRVARIPQKTVTMIYNMERRASRHRDRMSYHRDPIVILEFMADESLGRITFNRAPSTFTIPMGSYLRKTSILGGSRSRKFIGSDGVEYRWNYRTVPGQEWTCTTADNFLVAHFNLKPPHERSFNVSGNTLTIYESFIHIAAELLATLTIMRHIQQHNL